MCASRSAPSSTSLARLPLACCFCGVICLIGRSCGCAFTQPVFGGSAGSGSALGQVPDFARVAADRLVAREAVHPCAVQDGAACPRLGIEVELLHLPLCREVGAEVGEVDVVLAV